MVRDILSAPSRRAATRGYHRPMRVAIVGAGSAARRHADLARRHWPDATIGVRRVRSELPPWADEPLADDADIAAFAPELGVVASPAPTHVAAARALLDAGAHVVVEKPVATTAADAVALADGADRILVGYNLRFTAGLGCLRHALASGALGAPRRVRAAAGQWLPTWRPGTDHLAGVSARADLGGGALLELSHELDLVRTLLGTPAWVLADVRRIGEVTVDADDSVEATLGYPDAVASVGLDLLRRRPERRLTIVGDDATATWDLIAGTVRVDTDATSELILQTADDIATSYEREWAHIAEWLGGRCAPAVTIDDGIATLAIVDACRASSDSGTRTPVTMAT